jgi:hypothetical protein
MSQATTLTNKPNTAIFDYIVQKVKAFTELGQLSTTKSELIHSDINIDRLINWLSKVNYITGIQYSVIAAGQLYLKDRLIVKFTLKESYAPNFVLLRGLFEFGKPSGIIISANKTDKTFTLDVLSTEIENSLQYLETIFNWLAKEIKFKETLKEVILLKKEIRRKEALAYENLRSALA